MLRRIFVWLAWLYWYVNLPFTAAFAETALGYGKGEFRVHGRKVARGMNRFMHLVPTFVFLEFVGTLALLPLYSPPSQPKGYIARALVKFWYGLKSFFGHTHFLMMRKKGRTAMVTKMLVHLNEMAAQEENWLVKTIVTTTIFKWALAMSYLDEQKLWSALDYKPFTRRDFNPPTGPKLANPPETETSKFLAANVKTARQVAIKPSGKTTYVVVGSGAGGAMAARTLQERDPSARIVMIDGGPLMANDDFSDRAIPTVSKIFMNAAVTLSKDQQFVFQQGRCVGGSTVVNNSVAFKPEGFWWEDLKAKWLALGVKLDYDDLYRQYDYIDRVLNVQQIHEDIVIPGAHTVRRGWETLFGVPPLHPDDFMLTRRDKIITVKINAAQCIGCGRCNYGCQYESKQSMLVTLIPEFVRAGGLMVPDTQAQSIQFEQTGEGLHASGVNVTDAKGHNVFIEADRVILAAGAFASSKLLWRSGFTGAKHGVRTVGKQFSVNAGSPIIAVFDSDQGIWTGQQVAFALEIPELRMIIETTAGPPGIIAMTLPNWMDGFQEKLRKAQYMAAAVPVFSTYAYGEVKRGLLGESGFVIDFTLSPQDWRRLEEGFKVTARAMFRMGAKEVFINRFSATSIKSEEEIEDYFAGIGPSDFIVVQSAHMQGGNVIASQPYRGVVDSDCKVYGMDNVWVCDASVIPAPITVNIALTVMALARYAALRIPIGAEKVDYERVRETA